VHSDELLEHATVLVSLPERAPVSRVAAVRDVISYVNRNLAVGAFELNVDGEIRLRIGIHVPSGGADLASASTMLSAALATLDRYHVAFEAVLENEYTSPIGAITEAERWSSAGETRNSWAATATARFSAVRRSAPSLARSHAVMTRTTLRK